MDAAQRETLLAGRGAAPDVMGAGAPREAYRGMWALHRGGGHIFLGRGFVIILILNRSRARASKASPFIAIAAMPQAFQVPTLPTGHSNGKAGEPEELGAYLSALRRYLHMRPEIGSQEHRTSAFLREQLERHGLSVRGPLAETGFCVDIEGAGDGPAIGYRCDMDALPLQDTKQVPYASRHRGVAHACGHDAHMAVGAGVAILLHQRREEFSGRVRVFFQPNEEGSPSGSTPMIRDGVLESLEAVYCIHVDPTLDVGTFGLARGTVTAALDRFRVRVSAPSTGHSARPHQAKDTIWVATQLLHQFYQYVGRVTDARSAAVLTVCQFQGGHTHNVIPSEVEFAGTLRTLSDLDRTFLKQYMRRAVKQFSVLHEIHIELEFPSGMPCVVNDTRMLSHLRDGIIQLFGDNAAVDIAVPSMGSEDFSHYLAYVPGVLLRVGTKSGKSSSYPLHDAHFDIDEAALVPAVRLMTRTLLDHLSTHPLA